MTRFLAAALVLLSHCFSLAWFFLSLKKAKDPDAVVPWVRLLCCLVCPVGGPLFFALGRLSARLTPPDPTFAEDARASRVSTLVIPDEVSEFNVVPIEEALVVSHKSDLRRLLLNLLKGNANDALDAAMMAIESDDSEASHYSASAIADSLAAFHESARVLEEKLHAAPDAALMRQYLELSLPYLKKHVLSDWEQGLFLTKTDQVLRELYALSPAEVTSVDCEAVAQLALRHGDLDMADAWAKTLEKDYPDTQECFSVQLHVCYARGDIEGFHRWLDALKHSHVVIGKDLLDLIRTFG